MELPTAFRIVLGVLKAVAIAVGGALSILCLMAALSGLTHLLWVQLVPALILGVAVPLFLAERFGRDERGRGREGLATDLLATLWLGFTVIFAVVAFPYTRPLLAAEAEVLAEEGMTRPAQVMAWLARERPLLGGTRDPGANAPDPADAAPPATDGSPSALDAGPAPGDGGEVGDAAAGDEDLLAVDADLPPAPALPELTPGGIVDELAAAVVTISVRRDDGTSGSATGLIVDRDGTIVTAAAAVEGLVSAAVRIGEGTWLQPAILEGRDAGTGLAWLSVPSEGGLVEARQGAPDEVEVDAPLFIVANPLGLDPTLLDATLRGRREAEGINWLRLSAPVPAAALGAPVVNLRGEVVGLVLSVGRDVVLPVTSLAVVENGSGGDGPSSPAPRPMIW